LENCRMCSCDSMTPTYGDAKYVWAGFYFFFFVVWSSESRGLCTCITLSTRFAPVFKEIALSELWLHVAEELMTLESTCWGAKDRWIETITIHGDCVLRQHAGRDLHTERLQLPNDRQFESWTVW
jgi:hypothetical protein